MLGQLIFCLEALGVKGAVCTSSKVHIEGLLAGDGLDIDVAAAEQTDPLSVDQHLHVQHQQSIVLCIDVFTCRYLCIDVFTSNINLASTTTLILPSSCSHWR